MKFTRGLNRLVTCRMCGRQTHSNIDGCNGLNLCRECREEAEMENAHNDGYHDDALNADCPQCKEKARLLYQADKDAKEGAA